jgi:hypothetical protein
MTKLWLLILISLSVSFSVHADLSMDSKVNIDKSKQLTLDRREVNVNLAAAKLNNVRTSIQNYYIANNSFPSSLEVLVSSGVYLGNFLTPYGKISGVPTDNGFDLTINVPNGGSKEVITKMIASRSNATMDSGNTTFKVIIGTPAASLIVDSMLSRVADESRSDNNKMLQDFNMNGFDVSEVENLSASFINASESITTKEFTVEEQATFNQGALINTNSNTNNFTVSRLGGASQSIQTGVTDRTAEITYIEDTTSEGSGNFGVINFNLGGNAGEALITPLQITKSGLVSLGETVFTTGNDGSGSTLDADKLDGVNSTQFARRDAANTFTKANAFNAAIQANSGLTVDGKAVISADGSILYENNVALVNKYLGKLAKAADSEKLDGINSTQFARRDTANTFTTTNTFNAAIQGNGGLQVDGKWVVSSDGSILYENNVALVNKYLGKLAKAADSDKLDGIDSTKFLVHRQELGATEDFNDLTQTGLYHQAANAESSVSRNYPVALAGKLEVVNNGYIYQTYHTYANQGTYYRTKYGSTWYAWKEVADKGWVSANFLGKTAKSADSEKLDGINSTQFARRDAANTFTKANAFNAAIQANGGLTVDGKAVISADGNTLYENNVALSNKYLGKTAKAADADKLDGVNSTQFARTDLHETFTSNLTVKGRVYAENGVHIKNDWLRIDGVNGLYFQTYGGGWNMQDTTWIRAYNGKSVLSAGILRGDGGIQVDGKWMASADGNTLYENNVALSNKYLGKTAKAADADKLDGVNSTQFARRDAANTFTGANAFNVAIQANSGLTVDGKAVISADGNTLYENNVALSNKYLGKTAKAADADKLDGVNSTQFARTDIAETFNSNLTVNGRIYAKNGVHIKSDWLRIDGVNGLYFETYGGGWNMQDSTWVRSYGGKSVLSAGILRGDGGIQVDGKWMASADGNTLYENNVALSNKYLGKTAKAADADKLDGVNSTQFARRDAANTFTRANTFQQTATFNAAIRANGGLTVDGKAVISADGNTLYENNVALSNKYQLKGSANGYTYTQIFSSSSGLTRGDIFMSRSYTDFDSLFFIGSNDSNRESNTKTISVKEYELIRSKGFTSIAIYSAASDGAGAGWYGYFLNSRQFKTVYENAKIWSIYGMTKV